MSNMDKEDRSNRSFELCTRVVTTESLIEEAKVIYGDKYSYDKVNYVNKDHRIIVGCPTHGDFNIFAREHLDGKGCPKCAKGEKFIAKLHAKFGDRFCLDKFIYESSTAPVTLICPEHGEFSRIPSQILNSPYGCPECSKAINAKAHEEAVARKAALKKAKEQEGLNEINRRICEIEEYFSTQWNIISKWLDNKPKKADLHLYYCYVSIIDKHIDVIRYNAKWLDEYRNRNVVPDIEARQILPTFFEEGDILYKFKDEAAPQEIIEIYNENAFWGCSFEDILSHRDCNIHIVGKDLYILHKFRAKEFYPKATICKNNEELSLPGSFVSIDFETLYSQRVSVCSVGMVKYKDGQMVDRYYTLIKPPFDYPGKSGNAITWVHGFTESDFEKERTFVDILPEIEAFVEGLPLVAHNACVEKGCIGDVSAFYDLETKLDYLNIYDTLSLSRRIEKKLGIYVEGPGTHTLDAICRRFDVTELSHHNALDDAEMCGNLFVKFIEQEKKGYDDIMLSQTIAKTKPVSSAKYKEEDKVQRTDLDIVKDNPFKDCGVVLTGFSKVDSQTYGHQLKELGAIVRDAISSKTRWLICGINAGPSKLQKAQEMNINIIDETEFKTMLNEILGT